MADEDQDDSQKTEDPTQKRLDDALKKGQVPNSREVTSFAMLLVFALSLIWLTPSIFRKTVVNLRPYLESPHLLHLDSVSIITLSTNILVDTLVVMVPPVTLIILIIYISSLIQHPIVLSLSAPAPKLERISLLKGIKRLFSMKSFVEFIKGMFKIVSVAAIAYFSIEPNLGDLIKLPAMEIMAILLLTLKMATKILIGVCVFMGVVAVIDFIYQKYEHIKSMRMSLRDIKDEFKQTEGSPEIKAKLREIRNKRARERMMAAVPDADVVITNPTHYSIALKYDAEISEAPIVVAKGKDLIALKIREIAKENDVPIVENPPLARALFASVDLEQEIPLEHYNAVAEVIRYVYSLKNKKRA